MADGDGLADGSGRGPAGPAGFDSLSPGGDLDRFLDDLRIGEAAARRRRIRHLREAAAGDASLVGVLTDAAEAGSSVVVRTATGRPLRGCIELIGIDAVGIRSPEGQVAFVPLHAIATIELPSDAPAGPTRPGTTRPGPSFATIVATLAAEQAMALVDVVGLGATLAGSLRQAGDDVVALRIEGPPRVVHVALRQVSALVVLASG